MDTKTFAQSRLKIYGSVEAGHLYDAFTSARSLAVGMGHHAIAAELEQAEDGYKRMLHYVVEGADDPSRLEMMHAFGRQILDCVDCLERELNLVDAPKIYYNTLRYELLQKSESIASLLDGYRKVVADGSIFDFVVSGTHSAKAGEVMAEKERLERRIFNRVWTTHPLMTTDVEAVADAFASEALPAYFRAHLVWALTLGGMEFYDENRVLLLAQAYGDSSSTVSAAALIGLLLLMYRGRKRSCSRKLLNRIAALTDSSEFGKDVRLAYLELAKTIDTDRISRKIREEIVPEMLKLQPDIKRHMDMTGEKFDPEEIEENPEWIEKLSKSGLADKLKEMSEIQEAGGDVMMGTFAHLKSFPFFAEPANWFLPFHSDYSEFTGANRDLLQPVADLMANASFLCDSDKYSFLFTLCHVPAAQRDMMMQQFRAHGDQIARIQAASLPGAGERKDVFAKQVQNLYRFFKLFRRKGEFYNPFATGMNLAEIEPLKELMASIEVLPLVGEFYFSHGYYEPALKVFSTLIEQGYGIGSDQLFQKIGYANERLGRFGEAVKYFRKAEMLNSGSDWTLTHLARALMALGRYDEALERWQALDRKGKAKASTALNMGRCLLGLERYDEAVAAFFKVEYLDEKSGKALRPLAWSLLLSGDYEKSGKYYAKIFDGDKILPADHLNAGHLRLAEGRVSQAREHYRSYMTLLREADPRLEEHEAFKRLRHDLNQDMPVLIKCGVAPELVPLLLDSILYGDIWPDWPVGCRRKIQS